MRPNLCCHIYAMFLYLPLMCCAGFFISLPCCWQKHLVNLVDQGKEVCHLKFLDLVNTILNDKKVRISRNHFSADKRESIAYFFPLCRLGFESPAKALHLLGNFKQRSWIRIARKNSPILLQCARLVEKHL